MTHKAFIVVSGVIFTAVAFVHALRVAFKWEVIIGGWVLPIWLSVVGLLVAAYLAYTAYRLAWSRRAPGTI